MKAGKSPSFFCSFLPHPIQVICQPLAHEEAGTTAIASCDAYKPRI